MTEQDKISSDVEATVGSEQVAAPSTGRRKLVKGVVLAAPAILMIRNGYSRPLASLTVTDGLQRVCDSLGGAGGYSAGDENSPTIISFYGGQTPDVSQLKKLCQPIQQ